MVEVLGEQGQEEELNIWDEKIYTDGERGAMQVRKFDALPKLPESNENMSGPTEQSNYIVPG